MWCSPSQGWLCLSVPLSKPWPLLWHVLLIYTLAFLVAWGEWQLQSKCTANNIQVHFLAVCKWSTNKFCLYSWILSSHCTYTKIFQNLKRSQIWKLSSSKHGGWKTFNLFLWIAKAFCQLNPRCVSGYVGALNEAPVSWVWGMSQYMGKKPHSQPLSLSLFLSNCISNKASQIILTDAGN